MTKPPFYQFHVYFNDRNPGGVRILATFMVSFAGAHVFLEEALVSTEKLTYPSEVQSKPHLPSDVMLGQLVTERIGLENGIVLLFSS